MSLENLQKAYSHMTYEDFCEQCNFHPSQYALEKFQTFKQGMEHLNSFDSETLNSIANRYSWL